MKETPLFIAPRTTNTLPGTFSPLIPCLIFAVLQLPTFRDSDPGSNSGRSNLLHTAGRAFVYGGNGSILLPYVHEDVPS